jgi:hypothetical protein
VKDLDVLLDHRILVGLELAPGAHALQHSKAYLLTRSVADPDPNPDPPDPHVFGPPGSGSISQKYGPGSGSGSRYFYHSAKIVRKTLIFSVL